MANRLLLELFLSSGDHYAVFFIDYWMSIDSQKGILFSYFCYPVRKNSEQTPSSVGWVIRSCLVASIWSTLWELHERLDKTLLFTSISCSLPSTGKLVGKVSRKTLLSDRQQVAEGSILSRIGRFKGSYLYFFAARRSINMDPKWYFLAATAMALIVSSIAGNCGWQLRDTNSLK